MIALGVTGTRDGNRGAVAGLVTLVTNHRQVYMGDGSRNVVSSGNPNGVRIFAVDWSGRKGDEQKRTIWLCEAVGGELVRLECGRTRNELVDLLIAEAGRDPNLIVGIDFAFSLPGWYLRERELTARKLWAVLAEDTLTPTMRRHGLARWMNVPEPPFWTTSEGHALLIGGQKFRRTEDESRVGGAQPKSVFQLVGAGQVGRGSLYGMQALHRLAAAGFRIWPFDPPGLPLAVEIFPRLLTGPVTKSSLSERERYLESVAMAPEYRRTAATSEDAFDACVSAIGMAAAVEELVALPEEPEYSLEGKIWLPSAPVAWNRVDRRPRTSDGDIVAAVASVIDQASARGASSEVQAREVLDELRRRGELGPLSAQ